MNTYCGAILAAGSGRRMGVLSEHYPKPLLPIANDPIIVHHLRYMRELGIQKVYIVVGHGATQIVRFLGDGSRYNVEITYVEQGKPLGSAHAVGRLASHIMGPFLLILGDYYISAPQISRMLERAETTRSSVMAAKVERNMKALCEACELELNPDGMVVNIIEKPKVPKGNLKGCGVYVFFPEFFDAVRRTPRTALRDEYEISIAVELYIKSGMELYAEEVIEWDMNFTCPEDILKCNLLWLEHNDKQELIGSNVRLAEGTQLTKSIIGNNVVLKKPAALTEVVVFPDVHVDGGAHIQRTLITPHGLLPCPQEII